jgi:nitroreductase
MAQTARLKLGPAEPDGTRPGVVTDQGGLRVDCKIAGDAPGPAPRTAAEPALTSGDIAFLVATAARAPSVHNTQPWEFSVRGNVVELLADPSRKLHRIDPAGRELMISCGGALFGLRLGLRKLGYLAAVELLPDPARPRLAARVEPDGRAPMSRTEKELLAALPHRHTHRGPFAPGEIPARLLTEMRLDAAAEGGQLLLVDDPALVTELAGLVSAAAEEQRASPEIAAELARWVQPPDSQARDGVPASARLAPTSDAPARDALEGAAWEGTARTGEARPDDPLEGEAQRAETRPRLPQRDFGRAGTERDGGVPPSATAVLITAGDDDADWLRAGQALHRLLLRAATRWVFASLQSQPIELPRYRWQVAERLRLSGYPQMLLQFGRANTALATARRPKAELMTNDQQG